MQTEVKKLQVTDMSHFSLRRTPTRPAPTVRLRGVSGLNIEAEKWNHFLIKQSTYNVHYKRTFTTLLSKSATVYTLTTVKKYKILKKKLQFTVIHSTYISLLRYFYSIKQFSSVV